MRVFSSPGNSISVSISEGFINEMLVYCIKAKKKETGGFVIGKYVNDLQRAEVTHIAGPPRDSKFGSYWFYRGFDGIQSLINQLWKEDRGHYIGEWHFHPYSLPTPSQQDIEQMRGISANKNYQCKEPVLVIIGGNPKDQWLIDVSIIKNGNVVRLDLESYASKSQDE